MAPMLACETSAWRPSLFMTSDVPMAFREKTISKRYLALVTGAMDKGSTMTVDAAIDRHPTVK